MPAVAGGGPFEIAVAQGALEPYLDLCAEMGFDRIECASGFTTMPVPAVRAVQMARERGLSEYSSSLVENTTSRSREKRSSGW